MKRGGGFVEEGSIQFFYASKTTENEQSTGTLRVTDHKKSSPLAIWRCVTAQGYVC